MIAKRYIGLMIAGVVVSTGATSFLIWKIQSGDKTQVKGETTAAEKKLLQFSNSAFGFSFDYDPIFVANTLTDQDIKDNFLAIFESKKAPNQAMITVKKEERLQLVSSFSAKPALEVMLGNASKSLPITYPGYKEIRQQQFSWAGVNAAEIFFTYTATNGELAKHHMLILLKNQDQAVVFTFQALEKDFDRLDSEYFAPLRESIRFE